MRAIAFVWCYNEADIIGHVVTHLYDQGVGVHLLDNWSTDRSVPVAIEAAEAWGELLPVTHWPIAGPTPTVSWLRMLEHTEERAHAYADAYGPFWSIHHDADEIRRSSVPSELLIDFFNRVGRAGWNAVDHHVELYAPRDGYDPAVHHPERYFTERLRDHIDAHNGQIKAWMQFPDVRVDLASSSGHKVAFPGRKVCPEKLILKHYPMRGAEQRAAKAVARRQRWAPEDRARGWHEQYA